MSIKVKSKKVDKNKLKNNSKKIINISRYVIGFLLIVANIFQINNIKIGALFGVLFGLSFFPVFYDWLFKKRELKIVLSVLIPFILMTIWGISLPGEQLENIKIIGLNDVIGVNEKLSISYDTNLSKPEKHEFVYKSSNPEVATINDNGEIVGLSEGKTIISVTGENDVKTEKEITVKYIEIKRISVRGYSQLEVGNTAKLRYIIEPSFVSDKIVKWESTDPNIVEVDNEGNIKAISKGSAIISAVSERGKRGEHEVQTYIKIKSLKISKDTLRLEKSKTFQLSVSINPENADNSTISWSSSDTNVAKVSDNGLVTAVGIGNATITAKSSSDVSASSSVEVYEIEPKSLNLSKTSVSLMKGETYKITATVSPSNASDKTVDWFSYNQTVATVKNGVIKAEGRGTTTITAETSNGISKKIEVTVKEKSPITIKNFRYTKDYVCGIEWTFSLINNTKKQMNYVTLKWYNFNALKDPVFDTINGKNYTALRYTGPLKPGKSSGSRRNSTKFYNCDYKSSSFSEIEIEYADGTFDTISGSDFKTYSGVFK